MLSRDEAETLLTSRIHEASLYHHSLETEAVMRGLAEKMDQDVDLWGIIGLLHDLDFPETRDDPERHGLVTAELLEGKLPEEAIQAIKAHNGDCNGTSPESQLDWALRCGETVTGLVAANALVRPNGMEGMKPKSLKKKMKDKAFARNVNRDIIMECEKLGLDLSEFFQISIAKISEIADKVGLA